MMGTDRGPAGDSSVISDTTARDCSGAKAVRQNRGCTGNERRAKNLCRHCRGRVGTSPTPISGQLPMPCRQATATLAARYPICRAAPGLDFCKPRKIAGLGVKLANQSRRY